MKFHALVKTTCRTFTKITMILFIESDQVKRVSEKASIQVRDGPVKRIDRQKQDRDEKTLEHYLITS